MRLEYTQDPPKLHSVEDQRILAKVQESRAELGLLPVDLVLLHAPQVAEGWHSLFGAIRRRSSLPDDIRELAICRTGLINRAWYEWNIHSLILLRCENFDEAKFSVVKQAYPTSQGALDDRQWATLKYADAMTRHVTVPQDVFDGVKEAGFTQQQIVELTTTIAGYNMVSRFLVALDIGEANNKAPHWVADLGGLGSMESRGEGGTVAANLE
ncbi:AhpD-like protein [Leptodontidium sp. 2 PMI_412]|nr:AhpD-like protein [Leptodontidium sp. MPI-SDFR-AT-0119]KAH9207408.1 AhpD-like protein [Leptodontidium sp. 2 PMI_412]